MKVVVAGDVVVAIPIGAHATDVAHWINPGLLPDEYQVVDVMQVSREELEAMYEDE